MLPGRGAEPNFLIEDATSQKQQGEESNIGFLSTKDLLRSEQKYHQSRADSAEIQTPRPTGQGPTLSTHKGWQPHHRLTDR